MFDFRTIILLLFLSQNLCGQSDIFELARRGSVQEVKAVVKETPNVLNAKDQRGSTPLVLACYYNNFEVVEYLIQVVDDINGVTKDGSPLTGPPPNLRDVFTWLSHSIKFLRSLRY